MGDVNSQGGFAWFPSNFSILPHTKSRTSFRRGSGGGCQFLEVGTFVLWLGQDAFHREAGDVFFRFGGSGPLATGQVDGLWEVLVSKGNYISGEW